MYQNFIGIDIGKTEIFVAIHRQPVVNTYTNDLTGFQQLHDDHALALANGLVVLETTGGYETALIQYLQKHAYSVHRANTRKVKNFIRSYGKLGKSDSIDAKMLAVYGLERHASLDLFIENPCKKLLKLANRRSDLTQMLVQEKNRLQAPDQGDVLESIEAVIEVFKQQIKQIDDKIQQIYNQDELLTGKKEVLKTVPGLGDIISTNLLAFMPELGFADRRQIASLGGVAPHPNESGKKLGYRCTRGGRAQVKRMLFMAAMAAARSRSELGQFYERLVAAGKKKMVALTALMRKILVIANARLRDFYRETGYAIT